MEREFKVTDYGAVGNGIADCTSAFQAALDAAGHMDGGGVVLVPTGVYRVSALRIPAYVSLQGTANWSYRSRGGSVLKCMDDVQSCMLDITKGYGCRIRDLCLDGAHKGKRIHGISFLRTDFFDRLEEDTFCIENCQIRDFTGCGMYLQYACCFCIRHSHIIENGEDGIYLDSWDGFLLDNQISGNAGWAICCAKEGFNNSAMTLTGNRIEWNRKGGLFLQNAKLWNITGNFFDRSGGPAIRIAKGINPTPDMDPRWIKLSCHGITITGNIFNRSGADFNNDLDTSDHCHIHLEECFNVTVTGNTMLVGMNDGMNDGRRSPDYGVVIEGLKGCVISQNVMYKGYILDAVKDLGGHGAEVHVRENAVRAVSESDFLPDGHMVMKWEND